MDNRWANPEGYAQPPTAVRYEILDGDEVVQRETVSAWDHGRSRYYHCLQGKDQRMANEITALIQQACEYFYVPDGEYEPMEGRLSLSCRSCDARGVFSDTTLGRGGLGGQLVTNCPDCEGSGELILTDDEIRTRIDRINQGENTREAERSRLKSYPLDELPWDVQRALIEQIEALKTRWKFRILGESKKEPVEPKPPFDYGYLNG